MEIEGLEWWHFELTEDACNHLLGLTLEGKKRATSSSLLAFEAEGEKIPQAGELSVICDWDGNPRCVVRTMRVEVIPFRDVTFDLARLEGEDTTLESWRRKHEEFFRAEGAELGYSFSWDLDVVFEEFELVEVIETT